MTSAFGRLRSAFSSSIAVALAKGNGFPVSSAIRSARLSIHSHSDSLKAKVIRSTQFAFGVLHELNTNHLTKGSRAA